MTTHGCTVHVNQAGATVGPEWSADDSWGAADVRYYGATAGVAIRLWANNRRALRDKVAAVVAEYEPPWHHQPPPTTRHQGLLEL